MSQVVPFSLAIIGCGAVVSELHARTFAAVAPMIDVRLCVDVDGDRADQAVALVGGSAVAGGLEELLAREPTDGVLVALPNDLHVPTSIACLLEGRHVLCEKPAATGAAECAQLEQAIATAGRTFSVNLLRRFLPATIALRELVDESALGRLARFDVDEGGSGWPSRSGFQFVASSARGGVTIDRGPHVFDLLLGLLGKPTVEGYWDDATGGVEATSITSLRWPDGCRGRVRISKIEPWPTHARLTGAGGMSAIWRPYDPIGVRVFSCAGVEVDRRGGVPGPDGVRHAFLDASASMLGAWVSACRGTGRNPTPFGDVRAGCELIERLYGVRRALDLPWQSFEG